jgi:hypothetical protein
MTYLPPQYGRVSNPPVPSCGAYWACGCEDAPAGPRLARMEAHAEQMIREAIGRLAAEEMQRDLRSFIAEHRLTPDPRQFVPPTLVRDDGLLITPDTEPAWLGDP